MVGRRSIVDRVRREIGVYRRVLRHPRTPRLTRWILGAALLYLVTPVDLIPDVIPIIGHLDDVIIVPALLAVALWTIPSDVLAECRQSQGEAPSG